MPYGTAHLTFFLPFLEHLVTQQSCLYSGASSGQHRVSQKNSYLCIICELTESSLDPTESLIKTLNSFGLSVDPGGTLIVTGL